MMIAQMDDTMTMAPVDPNYARKLLRDVVAWAGSLGFAPHPEFVVVERLFGDVRADACDATFRFGREGEPTYMPGPMESPAQVRQRFQQLGSRPDVEKLEFAGLRAD